MAAPDSHPGHDDDAICRERNKHQRYKWLVIAIFIILVVGVAIGGGVGGALATKSKNTAVPSSTASSIPSVAPAASYLAGCSDSSAQNITITSVNVIYTVLCYFDCPFNDIDTFATPTLDDCIDYCSNNEICKGVAFAFNTDGQEPQCWLKSDVKTSKAEGNANRVCVLRGS